MKKLALTLSVLAASTMPAHAELKLMSDFELEQSTGQAGVDIGLDIGIEIGEIRYTDTEGFDSNGISDGDGGSLAIQGVFLGGDSTRTRAAGISTLGTNTDRLDNLKFSVDIDSSGDLKISGSPTVGGVGVVDYLLTADTIGTLDSNGDLQGLLARDLSIYGGVLFFNVTLDAQTNILEFETEVSVDDLDVELLGSPDLPGSGIKIVNAKIGGAGLAEVLREDGLSATLPTRVAAAFLSADVEATNDGINIDFNSSLANVVDIWLDEVHIGGSNIGTVALAGLDFNGVSLNISGH